MIKPIQAANVAKSIFYVHNAIQYLDYVIKSGDAKFHSKKILTEQRNSLQLVIDRFEKVLSPASRDALKRELSGDTMVFEGIYNVVVLLEEQDRHKVEEFAMTLLKGGENE